LFFYPGNRRPAIQPSFDSVELRVIIKEANDGNASSETQQGIVKDWRGIMARMTRAISCVAFASSVLLRFVSWSEDAETQFGWVLRQYPQGSIWWAEGTYKVFRETEVPSARSEAIRISAARNEYEPFQLVLRPTVDVPRVDFVDVTDFKSESGHIISARNVEVNLVEYVKIEKPTDRLGHVGMYPDPLPPWQWHRAHGDPGVGRSSLALTPGQNHPLWFTVYVPPETPAGLYRGGINLTVGGWPLPARVPGDASEAAPSPRPPERLDNIEPPGEAIPILLEVYDFTLPKETHTETAYGVSLNASYHGLRSREDMERTHDLYMQNCAKHRISPYDPMRFHPIKCRVEPNADDPNKKIQLDFSDFDKAAQRYLDECAFTTFNFASIVNGFDISPRWSTEEEKKLKAEVIRRVCDHLAEKGWLQKAYDYWIDEPPPDKYEEVLKGMMFLKEADPRLRRLLTFCHDMAPVPFFYGGVNLWVPVLSLFHPERAKERQSLGESVWWYVCCGPHHPYPNNFIDHPAINHRIRFWMIQKYGTNGSLYWSVTYWRQNPWETAMSYSPEGGTWGNGDGRLLYPPAKQKPEEPMVCGPINSIRFEMLREGLEDREYFCLLSREIERLKKKDDASVSDAIAEGEKTMRAADDLVRSLTDYEKDPKKLYEARDRIARTIVKLQSLP
jgi:hypothetical protein